MDSRPDRRGKLRLRPPFLKVASMIATSTAQRALLDQCCVTCHGDKTKKANLTLENPDLNTVGDHPELWEKVVRKHREGLMSPPAVRLPPLAECERLRNWLETEIHRKAATRPNPGSVILHLERLVEWLGRVRGTNQDN